MQFNDTDVIVRFRPRQRATTRAPGTAEAGDAFALPQGDAAAEHPPFIRLVRRHPTIVRLPRPWWLRSHEQCS